MRIPQSQKERNTEMECPEYLSRIRKEIVSEQVVRWDRQRIKQYWPEGYDISKVNSLSGDPAIEMRTILS